MKVKFVEERDVQRLRHEDYQLIEEDGQFYLLIGRGECRNGGYDIRLKDLILEKNVLTAIVEMRDPEPGMMVTMVITYPTRKYHLDLTEMPKEISFQQASGEILKVIRR